MSQVLQSLAQSVNRSGYGWWTLDPNMRSLAKGLYFEANALRAAIESHPSSPLIEILYNKLCEAFPSRSGPTPPPTPVRPNHPPRCAPGAPYPDFETSQHGCHHTHAGSTCGHTHASSVCTSEGGISSDMSALVTRVVEDAVRTALEAPERAVVHECTNVPRNDLQTMYEHFKTMECQNSTLGNELRRAYVEIEELKTRLTKINHNSCPNATRSFECGFNSQNCAGDFNVGNSAQMPGFGHNNCATAIEALEIDLRYHKSNINSLGEDFAAQLVDIRKSIHNLHEDFFEKLDGSNHDQCSATINSVVMDVQSNRKSIDSQSIDTSVQLIDVRESINSLREEFVQKLSGINHDLCYDTIGALAKRVESSEALIQKLNADFSKFNHDECSQAIAKLEIDLCASGNRIDLVSTEFAKKLKESNDNHKKTMGDVKTELQEHIDTFNGQLYSTWTKFVTDNSEAMNVFKSDLEERVGVVSAEFAAKLADLDNENSKTTSNLQIDVRANHDLIEAVSTELATKLRESNDNNAKTIDDVKTDLQGRFDGFVKELDSNMSKFATESTEAIKMIKTDLDERIDDVGVEFATKLRESDNNNVKAIDDAKNSLQDRIEYINAELTSDMLKVGDEAMDALDRARADFGRRIDGTGLEFAQKLTAFNDENSKTISDLEASLRSNKEHIDGVSADLTAKLASLSSDNTEALDNLNKSLSESNERMDTIAADFDKKLRDSNSHHTKAITGISTDLRSTRDQVYDSSSAVENLQAEVRSHNGRIKDNSEAIASMESLLNTTKGRFDTLDLKLSSELVSIKSNNTKAFRNFEVDINAHKQGIEELSASVSKIQEAVDHSKCPGELGKLRESVKHNKHLIDKLRGSINNSNKETTDSINGLKDGLKLDFDAIRETQQCHGHLIRNLEAKTRQNGYPPMAVAQSITPPPE